MKKVIKKIELDIDGKIISLTPEQIKKLKSALEELFPEKDVLKECLERVPKKEYIPIPYPIYPYRKYWEWKYDPYYYKTSSGTTCKYSTIVY